MDETPAPPIEALEGRARSLEPRLSVEVARNVVEHAEAVIERASDALERIDAVLVRLRSLTGPFERVHDRGGLPVRPTGDPVSLNVNSRMDWPFR
jgi:hypothetical protein